MFAVQFHSKCDRRGIMSEMVRITSTYSVKKRFLKVYAIQVYSSMSFDLPC